MKFFKKIKNNNGDAESIFFCFSVCVLILLLLFSMDLLRLTWQQYAVKRETESLCRVFAVSWPEAIYKSDGTEYTRMTDSKFIEDLETIVKITAEQGGLREFTISITDNYLNSPSVVNSYVYIEYKDGELKTSIPKNKEMYFRDLVYGKDLFLTAKVALDYKYTSSYNKGIRTYIISNKFANERYQKTEIS